MSNALTPLPEMTELNGYRIERVLYQGVFSFTYLAVSRKDGQWVVIKENIPGTGAKRGTGQKSFDIPGCQELVGIGSKSWAERNFRHEVELLSKLEHPGIIPVVENFSAPETGASYYVMPCMPGGTLEEVLTMPEAREREWVLYVAAALMETLKYVHGRGYIHRDIRPENVVFTADGVPVLIDFGAAAETLTARHTRMVVKGFSPPEQLNGEPEGEWTDVYALGATLYYIITGQRVPCAGLRTAGKAVPEVLAQRKELVQLYGLPFLESVDQALALNRSERFGSVKQWSARLSALPGFQWTVPVVLPAIAAHAASMLPPISAREVPGIPHDEKTELFNQDKNEEPTRIERAGGVVSGGPVGAVLLPDPDDGGAESARRRKKSGLYALLVLTCGLLVALALFLFLPTASYETGSLSDNGEESALPAVEKKEYLRVIGRVGAKLYDLDGYEREKKLPPFRVYYTEKPETRLIEGQERQVYVVRAHPRREPIGMLRADEVYPWPLNLAMRFTAADERNRALFFCNEDVARSFMAKSPEQRKALRESLAVTKNITPEAFRKLLSDNGVVGVEPQGGETQFMPVLDFARTDGKPAAYAYSGDPQAKARLLNVATMISKVEIKEVKKKVIPPVNVVFVVDTTSSMSDYLKTMKEVISAEVKGISEKSKLNNQQVLFGFVGYRDWKSADTTGSAAARDAEFTQEMGYVFHNYTKDRLLPPEEFLKLLDESGPTSIDYSTKDSIDFREDVFAAVNSAIEETPWSGENADGDGAVPHAYRCIYLIGDAGGREPNEREDERLKLNTSAHWAYRPTGSVCGKGVRDLVKRMEQKGIGLRSVFVLTMPLQNSGLNETDWLKYSQIPGIKQFAELASSNCDVFDTREHGSEHQRISETPEYRSSLENAVREAGAGLNTQLRSFKDFFATEMKEIVDYSLNVEKIQHDTEKIEGESAICRLFASGYVGWMVNETRTDETPGDATGWTQDRDEGHRSEALCPYLVLTAEQLEQLHQRLRNLLNLLEADMDSVLSSGKEADMARSRSGDRFTDAIANTLTHTQRDANELEGDMPGETDTEELRARIAQLPYLSPMLHDYCEGNVKLYELIDKLRNTLVSLQNLLNNRENNSNWLLDSAGNKKDDFVLIPINDLP